MLHQQRVHWPDKKGKFRETISLQMVISHVVGFTVCCCCSERKRIKKNGWWETRATTPICIGRDSRYSSTVDERLVMDSKHVKLCVCRIRVKGTTWISHILKKKKTWMQFYIKYLTHHHQRSLVASFSTGSAFLLVTNAFQSILISLKRENPVIYKVQNVFKKRNKQQQHKKIRIKNKQ